jgi:hypothetical protein
MTKLQFDQMGFQYGQFLSPVILRHHLSGFKTNRDVRAVPIDHILELSLELTLPLTQLACQALFTLKTIQLQAMENNSLELCHGQSYACI